MIKLYSAISGKKRKLIGEGESLIDAIRDADINVYEAETEADEEAYVRGAIQDYIIEEGL